MCEGKIDGTSGSKWIKYENNRDSKRIRNYRRRDELENNIKRNSEVRKIKLDFEFKTH